MKPLLVLEHQDYAHHEYWHLHNGEIFVKFYCPANYPSRGQHSLTVQEALCQFVLMVGYEGWAVEEDTGWNTFVQEYCQEAT